MIQLRQTSDATSLLCLCRRASVSVEKVLQIWHLDLPETKAEVVVVAFLVAIPAAIYSSAAQAGKCPKRVLFE